MYKKLTLKAALSVEAVSAGGYRNSDGSYSTKSGDSIYHRDGTYTTVDE